MKHKSYLPDLSDWNIPHQEERQAVESMLHEAFLDDETYLYFPVKWSKGETPGTDGLDGPEVADPLTVYLRVGLDSDGEKPTYQFNLRETLKKTIEDCTQDGSYSIGLGRLSVALRELADEIDVARKAT